MTRLGASLEFEHNKCRIMRNSKLLGIGEMQGMLYALKVVPIEHMNIAKENTDMELWHTRFGHLGYDNVSKLIKGKMVEGMNCDVQVKPKTVCELPYVSHTRKEFQLVPLKLLKLFIVMSVDLCQLVLMESLNILSLLLIITQDTHMFILLITSMKC